MKIDDSGSQQLPNGLILHHITELEKKYIAQKRESTIPPNLKAALRDAKTCLMRPPTFSTDDVTLHGNIPKGRIVTLTRILEKDPYNLLPSEIMMILNHRPETKEELAGLVEELEDRMPEEETQDALLKVVKRELGKVRAADIEADTNGDGR